MIVKLEIKISEAAIPVESEELDNYLEDNGLSEDEVTAEHATELGKAAFEEYIDDAHHSARRGTPPSEVMELLFDEIGGSIDSIELIEVQFDEDSEIELP